MPSPERGIDEPRRVADQRVSRPLAGGRAERSHRQPMPSNLRERGPDRPRAPRASPGQVRSELWPFVHPPRPLRGSRGLPWERPSRSPPERRRVRPRLFRDSASGSRAPQLTFPSSATPSRMSAPSPNVRATIPFAPSAPTTYRAATEAPATRAEMASSVATISLTAAPSLNSTPASVACSARKASSRRRCVMRMTGLRLRRSQPAAIAGSKHEAVDDVLDDRARRRRERAGGHGR